MKFFVRATLWAGAACALALTGAGCATQLAHKPGVKVAAKREMPLQQGQAYAHYLASIVAEQQGHADQAAKEMEETAALDTESAQPLLRLIQAYVRAEQHEKAMAVILLAEKQLPDAPALRILEGKVRQQMKQYPEALAAFNKAIELNPDNPLAYGALVDLQESTNDLVAAAELYERLLELNPGAGLLHFRLALNLLRMDDFAGAREHLIKALELDPKMDRARFFLGVVEMEAGDPVQAIVQLAQYIQARPKDTDAIENMASCLGQAGRYADAVKWFTKLAEAGDFQPADYLVTMYLLMQADQPGRVESMAPPSGAPLLSAVFTAAAREMRGEPVKAVLDSLDTIQTDIDDECGTVLSRMLHLAGEENAGPWLFDRVTAFRKLSASRNLGLLHARLLMSSDRYAEAADELLKLLKDNGADYWPNYYRALCCQELGRAEETEAHLRVCLDTNPDDPDLLNFLGYFFAEKNIKLGEARSLIEKALAANAENAYYLDSMGWVYYREGNAKKAVEYIERAIRGMENDDAILRDHLGDAYLLDGNKERAVAEWKKAMRLDPKREGLSEKIKAHESPAKEPKS